jgi:hypothetical protein
MIKSRSSSSPNLLRALALAATPFLSAGCATLFTGTTDVVTFDSNVPGVRLTIDGQYRGELPITLTMSRNFVGGRQFNAKFERTGWHTQEFQLNREFNPVAILDITCIPTSGGVDVLTGALMKFSPTDYHVHMLQAGASVRSGEFQRSLRAWQFALGSYQRVQADLARGGGEHLDALAVAVTGGDREASARFREEAVRSAPVLLGASSAREFVARLDGVLAGDPALRAWRI